MKKQTIEEKILDAYKAYPSFVDVLSENGKLLLGQITSGTKTLDSLSDRDRGRWKGVVQAFEKKWGGEQMYDLSQAETEDEILLPDDDDDETDVMIVDDVGRFDRTYYQDGVGVVQGNEETDFKSQSNKSEPKTPADESDESIDVVFRLMNNGKVIDEVDRVTAIGDLVSKHTGGEIKQWLRKGSVLHSDTASYSITRSALEVFLRFETDADVLPPECFEIMGEDESLIGGRILTSEKDNHPFNLDEAECGWTPENDGQSQSLIKREDDGTIQGEVEFPMTEADILFRESLENEFRACEDYVKNARYKQGEIVKEIIERRLYRNTHKTFGEYAVEVLNLTREYAIQIANISHYPRLLEEAIDASEGVIFSINAGIAMDKSMRRLAEETGLENEFEMMRPFIVDSFRALVDIAPKDKQGNPVLSPPLVTKYGEVMREVVQSGTVTIDGEQMTIHEAKTKGLLQHGVQMEVLTATEETIRAKQDYISGQALERYKRKTEPVIRNYRSTAKDEWIGQVPQLDVNCTEHGETEIVSIGNGTFQCACKCRFQIDNDTKTLVCFEAENKRI